jgi:septal ring factor EnvC (AmiA/AmiB activator)
MENSLSMLDSALEISEKELNFLLEEDYDQAQELATQRQALIEKALKPPLNETSSEVARRLSRLRDIQGKLNREAKDIHSRLKDDLVRIRGEKKRLNGYGSSSKVLPFVNHFVSKQG